MSHINERWVAIDGSVYTETQYVRQAPGGEVKYRPGIAFNVGQMSAEHIVSRHNAALHAGAPFAESTRNIPLTVTGSELAVLIHWHREGAAADTEDMNMKARCARRAAELNDLHKKHRPVLSDDLRAAEPDLPPPHDSLGEAQRAADIWPAPIRMPQEAEPATVRAPHRQHFDADVLVIRGEAPGMSSVMQVQGSSLRPVEIGQAVAASEPAPKPCCGCRRS